MFRRQTSIGIDLGQHSIKCAVVGPERGTVKTLWQGEILPDRKSHDQELSDDESGTRLRELLDRCRAEGVDVQKAVSTAIQGEGTIFRYIELPPMSRKEMDTAVPSVARKSIPFPMNEISLSFIPVPQITRKEKKSGAFFVAAPKKTVESLQVLLKRCAIDASKIEPAELALTRTFSRNLSLPRGQISGLIHVGFHLTHIVVVQDGFPYFARSFSLAGRKFTYAFQMAHQSSWEDAEKYKTGYDAKAREVPIEPFLGRWLDDVKKSFGYFTAQFPDEKPAVKSVYLSGGSALMQGLDARLEEYLGLPVKVPGFEKLKSGMGKPQAQALSPYEIAVGLALED